MNGISNAPLFSALRFGLGRRSVAETPHRLTQAAFKQILNSIDPMIIRTIFAVHRAFLTHSIATLPVSPIGHSLKIGRPWLTTATVSMMACATALGGSATYDFSQGVPSAISVSLQTDITSSPGNSIDVWSAGVGGTGLTIRRLVASAQGSSLVFQSTDSLDSWNDLVITDPPPPGVAFGTSVDGLQPVTVRIAKNGRARLFGRLQATFEVARSSRAIIPSADASRYLAGRRAQEPTPFPATPSGPRHFQRPA